MTTIEITRRYDIACAHHLNGLRAGHKCARVHGHNYRIELTIRSQRADPTTLENGFVIDAADLDTNVMPVLARLDHHDLNECDDGTAAGKIMAAQPTVEFVALYLWERLGFLRNGRDYRLVRVRVFENERLWADVPAS